MIYRTGWAWLIQNTLGRVAFWIGWLSLVYLFSDHRVSDVWVETTVTIVGLAAFLNWLAVVLGQRKRSGIVELTKDRLVVTYTDGQRRELDFIEIEELDQEFLRIFLPAGGGFLDLELLLRGTFPFGGIWVVTIRQNTERMELPPVDKLPVLLREIMQRAHLHRVKEKGIPGKYVWRKTDVLLPRLEDDYLAVVDVRLVRRIFLFFLATILVTIFLSKLSEFF